MKLALRASAWVLTLLCTFACDRGRQQVKTDGMGSTSFATAEEAISKAKADLLSILSSGNGLALGVDEAALTRSEPEKLIPHYQITFEQLATADSFASMSGNELATVVPFVSDNAVTTVVQVAKDEKGWRVAALVDSNLSNDLNALRVAAGDTSQADVTIYALPHASTRVYGVKKEGTELFYSDYPSFSVAQGVAAELILPSIKRDAAEFQKIHGAALKEKKLVR
jgi:hypothetical protein